MTRRERHDLPAKFSQVFRFTCKHHRTILQGSVIQRADADRITGCDHHILLMIVENHCKFRIQCLEEFQTIFVIQRKNDFTVRTADDRILF